MRRLLVLLCLVGCHFSPDYGNGDFACGPNGECPPNLSCDTSSNRCVQTASSSIDASTTDVSTTPRPDGAFGVIDAAAEPDILGGLPLGSTCTPGVDLCHSGHCVDGVCCESACNGQCELCDSSGTCNAVTGDPQGGRPACNATDVQCAGTCDGNYRMACTYPTNQCRDASCTNGVAVDVAYCSGGACPASTTTMCSTTADTRVCGQTACAGVAQIAVGIDFVCALTTDGSVWCWGDNWAGIAGVDPNSNPDVLLPSRLPLTGVKWIGAGNEALHVCAVLADDTVTCWGDNRHGQLGIGSVDGNPHYPGPVVVDANGNALTDVKEVDTGGNFGHYTCAVKNDGSVWCWGNDSNGQLADGVADATRDVPYAQAVMPAGTNGTTIVVCGEHACISQGIGYTAAVKCWGAGYNGEAGPVIGNNTVVSDTGFYNLDGTLPHPLGGGEYFNCGIASDADTVWCWGGNNDGAIGNGVSSDTATHPMPSAVCTDASCTAFLTNAKMVTGGDQSACALLQDGTVKCWGHQTNGEWGDNDSSGNEWNGYAAAGPTLPLPATYLEQGAYTTYVILSDRSAMCMGRNYVGECATGSASPYDIYLPTPVFW